ncbi:hypothetical protein C1T17_08895 [Sphingobium sp. SCG-1]|nr:hypothetical protein C1T17_08895 [Sphingobium sp. SCG-1]
MEASAKIITAAAVMLSALFAIPANGSDTVGPGRFCGYSPIIDPHISGGRRIGDACRHRNLRGGASKKPHHNCDRRDQT